MEKPVTPGPQPVRIFKCSCGHTPRYGSRRCGNCWKPTPLYNRRSFPWVIGGAAVAGAVLIAGVALTS